MELYIRQTVDTNRDMLIDLKEVLYYVEMTEQNSENTEEIVKKIDDVGEEEEPFTNEEFKKFEQERITNIRSVNQ